MDGAENQSNDGNIIKPKTTKQNNKKKKKFPPLPKMWIVQGASGTTSSIPALES